MLESTPPLRKQPSGTSAIKRRRTASSSARVSRSAASVSVVATVAVGGVQ